MDSLVPQLDIRLSTFETSENGNFPEEIQIISPRGNIYTISGLNYPLCDPICSCRGFQYRGTCSHIENYLKQKK